MSSSIFTQFLLGIQLLTGTIVEAKTLPTKQTSKPLAADGLLIEQDWQYLLQEAEAHRRMIILDESCSLSVFFSESSSIPSQCKVKYDAWKKAQQKIKQPPASTPANRSLAYENKFNAAKKRNILIDADGLAWQVQYKPSHVEEAPEEYTLVRPNGQRIEFRDHSKTEEVRRPASVNYKLMPNYSRQSALENYRKAGGK